MPAGGELSHGPGVPRGRQRRKLNGFPLPLKKRWRHGSECWGLPNPGLGDGIVGRSPARRSRAAAAGADVDAPPAGKQAGPGARGDRVAAAVPTWERTLQDPRRKLAIPTSRCLIEETDSTGRGLGVLTEMAVAEDDSEVVKALPGPDVWAAAGVLREVPLVELGRACQLQQPLSRSAGGQGGQGLGLLIEAGASANTSAALLASPCSRTRWCGRPGRRSLPAADRQYAVMFSAVGTVLAKWGTSLFRSCVIEGFHHQLADQLLQGGQIADHAGARVDGTASVTSSR